MDGDVSPILSVTRRDAVLSELRDAILTRRLAPGTRLREVQLAKDLGVSRPTLREAIYQLIHEGLLVQEDFKGVTVAAIDRQTILDIAMVRAALESAAARTIAADRGGPSQEALRAALAEYERAAAKDDAALENEAHVALHHIIWVASGSPLLQRIWPIVSTPVRSALIADHAAHPGDTERSVGMHRQLVEAILSNRPEVIDAVVHEHIEASANLLLDVIAAQEQAQEQAPDGV